MSRKITLLLTVLLVMSLSLATGCFSQRQLLTPTDIPVADSNASVTEVKQAIFLALAKRGWISRAVSPGLITARLAKRQHIAAVDIHYSSTNFSITYKNSGNLGYDAEDNTIHRKYNGWVQNLSNDINANLNKIK